MICEGEVESVICEGEVESVTCISCCTLTNIIDLGKVELPE